ncbi:MAG: SCO family protein [Saprospiraceae bacterium]
MSKIKKNNIWVILSLSFFLFGLPLGSWYYLNEGLNYSKSVKKKLESKGEVPAFSFTDQNGQVITNDSLKGKLYVADFFFASCPNECLEMAENLKVVQEAFKDHPKVVIVSFSTDPYNDTTEVLKKYADGLGALPNQWYFLRGEQKKIFDLAKKGFKLPADTNDNDDDIVHSPYFAVVDAEGQIRNYYDGTSFEETNVMITHMSMIMPRKPDPEIKVEEKEEL